MATYEVEGEDGQIYEVEDEDAGAPETAPTQQEQGPVRAAGAALGSLVRDPVQKTLDGGPVSINDLGQAAMSPVPGSLAALTGRVLQQPSEFIRNKLSAEGHPILGEIAGIAADPTTYAGAGAGAGAAKGAIRGAAKGVAGFVESAYPKIEGKMMQIFERPSTVLPNILGGPAPIAQSKKMLNDAMAYVLQRLKATSLETIDKSAKTLTRAKSGLSDDVLQTADQVRIQQSLAAKPELASTILPSKVPVEKLVEAEQAMTARISKLWDEGLGDHAQAMQQELYRIGALVDQALPQLKDARLSYRLSKLREEVTGGGILNTAFAGMTPKKLLGSPGLVSYGQAALGAANKTARPLGAIAGATASPLERLSRRYLTREKP